MTEPLPPATRLRITARVHDGGRLLIGDGRLLRLSDRGPAALRALVAGEASVAERGLGRRLVDAGMAHPVVAPAPADVTLVIPVRDRAEELDRCLAAAGKVAGVAGEAVGGGVAEGGERAAAGGRGRPGSGRVVVVDDGSADAAAVATVCARHGARVVRRERSGGPAAARNDGVAAADTELVAFLDSDCVAPPGWIAALAGHFADPLVAAVAPRVVPLGGATLVDRYLLARSPLDMGPRAGQVRGAVPYVPSAALIVRRELASFDPALRYGEDVDLVWRLHDAGRRIRYDPSVLVRHAEPRRLKHMLARRFRYGTSAALLAKRHPGRLAPVVIQPAAALLAARRPGAAAGLTAVQAGMLARRLPARLAAVWSLQGLGAGWLAIGRAATQFAPLRAELVLAPPLGDWLTRRPPLNPAAYLLLRLADEAAYGAGVYAGALAHRTVAPLTPGYNRRTSNYPNREHL